LQRQFVPGGALALALFEKAQTLIEFEPDSPVELHTEAAYVSMRREVGSPYFYNPAMSLPPVGSCTAWSVRANRFGGDAPPGLAPTGSVLDAGTLQIQGAGGADFVQSPLFPDLGVSRLDVNTPGSLVLSSMGGQDTTAFNVTVAADDALAWTNRDQIRGIDRRDPLRVEWTAQSDASTVVIAGSNYDVAADAWGGFLCRATANFAAFEVPPHILSIVPASRPGAAVPWGRLYVAAVTQGGVAEFQATGLDRGLALFLDTAGRTVTFR
jgi:hypothetical protein